MPNFAALGFLYLLVASLLFGMGALYGRGTMTDQYARLAGKVEQANDEAKARQAELIAQRDQKQAELERLVAEQERLDAEAKAEIGRLAGELERRPFRVRIVTEAGQCRDDAGSGGSAGTDDSGGNAGPSYGLLPEENTRRLGEALTEVETLSAAYNSCRAYLGAVRRIPP